MKVHSATIQKDFPLLKRIINGKRIVYLDSTATSLKPQSVIDAVNWYYTESTANVFRGIYSLSEVATEAYEKSRKSIAQFINADPSEIIFTRNTTEAINLLAYTVSQSWKQGDSVVSTILEHHSNFVPWQQLALLKHANFVVVNPNTDGCIAINSLSTHIQKSTKVFACTAVSNVFGTIQPVAEIVHEVKRLNPDCVTLIDAAQAVPHMPVDVRQWGADAIAFSGHKMCGPSGIGVLWVRKDLLERLPPFLFGGDMIREVYVDRTEFNDIPHRFEAGTPYIEGAIGLGAAVDYLSSFGMQSVRDHEIELTSYALEHLSAIDGLNIYGTKNPQQRGGVLSFSLSGIHPHDIASMLNEDNICVRAGYHCAMPLHEYYCGGPTIRASFYLYTTKDDVDMLVEGLKNVQKVFC